MKSIIPSGVGFAGVAMTSKKESVVRVSEKDFAEFKPLEVPLPLVGHRFYFEESGSISEKMKNSFALFKLKQHAKNVIHKYEDDTGTIVSIDYDSKTTLSELIVFMREVEVTLGVVYGLAL